MGAGRQASQRGSLPLATLLDYLPRETIVLLCDPEQLALRADEYASKFPKAIRFLFPGRNFCRLAAD